MLSVTGRDARFTLLISADDEVAGLARLALDALLVAVEDRAALAWSSGSRGEIPER